ncbi:hypothetical protein NMG60_11019096 [Bertholletia excelsa]
MLESQNPNSRLSLFPPEPVDFNHECNAPVDMPFDTAIELKKKEEELQTKEAKLRREQVQIRSSSYSSNCSY